MDWRKEAEAVIDDVRPYVSKMHVCRRHESNEHRIYFKIKTLEQQRLVVAMDSRGFTLCNNKTGLPLRHNPPPTTRCERAEALSSASSSNPATAQLRPIKTYETINALLDDNCNEYRKKFVGALLDRIDLILSDQP